MANLRGAPEMVPRYQGTHFLTKASAIFQRRSFCAPPTEPSEDAVRPLVRISSCRAVRRTSSGILLSAVQLKQDWLRSLSFPSLESRAQSGDSDSSDACVIGIDPDSSGALALLRGDTAQVSYFSRCLFKCIFRGLRINMSAFFRCLILLT